MRFGLVLLGLLLTSAPALGQTITKGPVPATAKFSWEAPTNVTTVAQALTFEPRLYRGTAPLTALVGATCVLQAAKVVCTAPVSQSNLDAINQVGVQSLTLSLFRLDVGEGPPSVPFVLTTPAGAPTGFSLIP
jgi:hypothetical protein